MMINRFETLLSLSTCAATSRRLQPQRQHLQFSGMGFRSSIFQLNLSRFVTENTRSLHSSCST